ncbi:hypothetical protein K3495_g11311 [Podosphaera aphanis]|nr:hypothetical protein K3495_g11311 [Podosphaera aphanis]
MLLTAQLAINNRDSSTSTLSPFFLDHGYHAEPVQLKSVSTSDSLSARAKRADKFVDRIKEAQEFASAAMAAAQQQMEDQANRKRDPAPQFKVDDKVWLSLKNIPSPQPKKKLAWVIKVISPHVVELDVPTKIWPRFHVDLIRRAGEDPLPSQIQDDSQPPPVMVTEGHRTSPEQVVQRILRAEKVLRGRGWVRRVLVKWKGFAEPTWEDRSELENMKAMDAFEDRFGKGDGVGELEGARQGKNKKKNKKFPELFIDSDSDSDSEIFSLSQRSSNMSGANNQSNDLPINNQDITEQMTGVQLSQDQANRETHQVGSSNSINIPPAIYQAICNQVTQQIMSQLQNITQIPATQTAPPIPPTSEQQPIPATPLACQKKSNKWPIWDGSIVSFESHILNLRIKIEEDREFLGSNRSICLGIFNSLPVDKQPRVMHWYRTGGPKKTHKWESFLEHIVDQLVVLHGSGA